MSSEFGNILRVSVFGQSHQPEAGGVGETGGPPADGGHHRQGRQKVRAVGEVDFHLSRKGQLWTADGAAPAALFRPL